MSVTEVAVACGFSSSAYFSTAYRARFGRSPREDRDPAWPHRDRSAIR
jgi:AraC family carnitine catabolism transcriptional activator